MGATFEVNRRIDSATSDMPEYALSGVTCLILRAYSLDIVVDRFVESRFQFGNRFPHERTLSYPECRRYGLRKSLRSSSYSTRAE